MWIFPNTFFRNSHQRCSIRKGVLKNLAEFTGKHLYQSLFFYKVADIRPATLFKKGDPGTGEFLWILLNFKEHLFHRRLLGDCFCFCFFFLKYLSSNSLQLEHCYYKEKGIKCELWFVSPRNLCFYPFNFSSVRERQFHFHNVEFF